MSIQLLKENIEREKQIIKKILDIKGKNDKKAKELRNSLFQQLKIINSAIPNLINNIVFYKSITPEVNTEKELLRLKYAERDKSELNVAVRKGDEKKFLESIALEYSGDKTSNDFSHYYIKFSNSFFKNISNNLVDKGYFDSLKSDLRKITSSLMVNTYVSIMFLTTVLSFIISLLIFVVMLILKVPLLISIFVVFAVPLGVFLAFYRYPSSRRNFLEKEINQELPFLTIYMSAISTSGIEPFKIFSILVSSNDYPYTGREVRKLTNYINFYGYDIVSALRLLSKNCPSERLALLFDGLATTITSGGELADFLSKHSETLLFDYRLEREKYTQVAETFMNIYISVAIAAPMILMIVLILMGMTGMAGVLTPSNLSFLLILILSLLNIGFLLLLNTKQPKF